VIEISVDLETASSSPDAAIMAIGAASSGGATFECYVDDPQGAWSPDTIRWLAAQSSPHSIVGTAKESTSLLYALREFGQWLLRLRADQESEARLWTHATFDMPILELAYLRAQLSRPWHYRNCRDLRTLYDLAGGRPTREENPNPNEHNALSDAQHQLREVQICLGRLSK
jgi:exodeoxyribonuclease VIII